MSGGRAQERRGGGAAAAANRGGWRSRGGKSGDPVQRRQWVGNRAAEYLG